MECVTAPKELLCMAVVAFEMDSVTLKFIPRAAELTEGREKLGETLADVEVEAGVEECDDDIDEATATPLSSTDKRHSHISQTCA